MSVPGTGIGPGSPTPHRLEGEQIRLLYANLPPGVIAGLLNAGLLVYIQRDVIASGVLAVWFGLMALLTVARLGLFLAYRGLRRGSERRVRAGCRGR